VNVLALCAGAGGLELGVKLAVPGARCVGYVERDAFAAAVLVARMEDAALDSAPVWDDVADFDGRSWRGVVDCVAAGFPCQPFSAAGKRRGTADERWLWPDIARVLREVGPRWVFLENVPGLVRRGLADVLRDLAALGFDAEWGLLSAAAVGAPHKRERLFLLAHARRGDHHPEQPEPVAERGDPAGPGGAGAGVADAAGGGARRGAAPGSGGQPPLGGQALADADRDGRALVGRGAGERQRHPDRRRGARGLADADVV
jgi:DNA (cytosine-5)-methyltransferase 1